MIEVTGISMMLTAQGADHTAGNLPAYDCKDKSTEELTRASMDIQTNCAAVDSLGICVFGRSVTNVNHDFIVEALNNALGTELDVGWFYRFGVETLKLEDEFNEKEQSTIQASHLTKRLTIGDCNVMLNVWVRRRPSPSHMPRPNQVMDSHSLYTLSPHQSQCRRPHRRPFRSRFRPG